MEKTIVLIGGAPTVGKSYFAEQFSREVGISWISTDTIRSVMRETVRKEDFPNLFFFEDPELKPEQYLLTRSADEIVDDQNKESMDVWKGATAFLKIASAGYISQSFIIEGVAVLP